jgi:NADH:ubiquinone reductase (H+-translocating)
VSNKKHIIVAGGGFAGVKFALEMSECKEYKITLITPHQQLEYHGALYRSATGHSPLEVVVPFSEIFANHPNVEVVNDLVTEIRAPTTDIKCQSGRTYGYDEMVFAIGAEIEYYGIKGMRDHSESIYTIYDTIKLRNRLRDCFLKNNGKEVDIVMVGGGPVGVEVAGDIKNFAKLVAAKYNKPVCKPHVKIVDRAPRPLPMFGEGISDIALARLHQLGIKFVPNAVVKKCTTQHLCLEDGKHISGDVIIWSAGSRANSFFEKYPGVFALDPRKKVIVNEFQQTLAPNIYVLGDSASTPYSGMALTAINDGKTLATNMKAVIDSKDAVAYNAIKPDYIAPIGPNWAIAQVGEIITTGDEAWTLRRQADLAILRSFLPENLAQKHWKMADKLADI